MEPRGDAMGGLIEYLKTKDSVILTSWTKNPRPWTLHPYNKVVATVDTISASSGSIEKSDKANIPSVLDAEYKGVNKNELKFRSDSWQYCSSEMEKQFVVLLGSLLYYFQCARMLQLSSSNLFFNVWMQDRTHRVDARMKFRDRVLKFLEGRHESASFGRLLSGLREYKRDTSERDTSDFYFNGLVFTLEETVKELCMMMSIALRFETWSLPARINEFANESHFPVLRCIGRGITLSEALLISEDGDPMKCEVPAGSAVVFGTVGVREFVIWKPPGSNKVLGSTVLVWNKPLLMHSVSYAGDNEAQKWLFSISCAVIIDFYLEKDRCIQRARPSFSVRNDIFRRLGPKILENMPMCKNRAVQALVSTVFALSKSEYARTNPEHFTSDRINRSVECLGVVMDQWLLPLLTFHDPFKDHFLHVLSLRRHAVNHTHADEVKEEKDGNGLTVTNGDALVNLGKPEAAAVDHPPMFFGSKSAAEVSDEFIESLFDEFCDCAPNACATLPSVMELDSKRSNLDNMIFDIYDSCIKPFEDSSARLSSFIHSLKGVFHYANELIAEFFISKLIYLGQFLVSPEDPLYRKMALTSFGLNIQNSYEVVRKSMLKDTVDRGSGLDLLDWKVREQLLQDVIDFCIIVRFATPKQSILRYLHIGGIFAFDKTMMTALDGNVDDGEACRLLVPPVTSQPPTNGMGEVRSDAIAPVLAPITKAVVIPL